MKNYILPLGFLVIGFLLARSCSGLAKRIDKPDTVTVTNVRYSSSVPDTVTEIIYVRMPLLLNRDIVKPSVSTSDTADAKVTFNEQGDMMGVETKDTTYHREVLEYGGKGYRAWVSGIDARLEEIDVEKQYISRIDSVIYTIDKTVTIPARKKHFAFGPSVTLGANKQGIGWMAGVSLVWNIWGF